ncbi:helix-turn-helix domain-containing protein [Clostridium felsineum]|uniref:helix-turn-helix domain-containing protein n=1 Tax=Clostridium felsineum TaxID=36839 RepID=UPI00098BEA1A|nr:helix-turn-helix transcriptional regulator [Clostridium felsineum]URZ04093.1 hypothetical protein CLAUR_041810 [Clostridium felsineum]
MNNKLISERLKDARAKRGISQRELANRIGVTKSVISGAESKRGVSKNLAIKLATFFKTSVAYWLNENAEEEFIQSYTGLETLETVLDKLISEGIIISPEDIRKDEKLLDILLQGLELEIKIRLIE